MIINTIAKKKGMKKVFKLFVAISIAVLITSCNTSDDLKEISGTLIFNEIGAHSFSINAENIEATITMVGPNNGEKYIFEHVPLNNTAEYTAKIGLPNSSNVHSALLNNLVVMYEAKSGKSDQNWKQNGLDSGFVKIDWRGYN